MKRREGMELAGSRILEVSFLRLSFLLNLRF